jgi:hypothetical protein
MTEPPFAFNHIPLNVHPPFNPAHTVTPQTSLQVSTEACVPATDSHSTDFHTRYTNPARSMTGLAGLLSNRYKVEDIPDQTGKVAIVTGGSAGIGQQIVNDLVQKGAEGESEPPPSTPSTD